MNKKKYIAFPILLSLLSINSVYAACTEELENEYIKIKNQYKITPIFNSIEKNYTVRIEQPNTNKFRYTTAITSQYKCEKISDTVTECYGLKPGTSFYAYVLGNTKECDIKLKEEEIYLDKLNKFYGDPLCSGVEEFVLCQEIYDREISRETFEYRINKYKESKELKHQEELKKQEEENKKENKISTYIKENTTQVIIIAVFIILVIITIMVGYKSMKKSRRLE